MVHFIYGFLLFILVLFGCNSSTEPPISDIPPGKRDYVWSIDIIDYGNLTGIIQLESIWGSSAEDIWGANGDAVDVRDCLWHYDGIKWARATEGTPITEFTGNKVVYAVWGTARNNVWAFGRKINQNLLNAFIMQYDGTIWTDATPSNVSALSANLYCVYGSAANNIWVGGYEYALNYDGAKWNVYKIADSIIVGSISGNGTYLYLSTYSPWGKEIYNIYMLMNGRFNLLDESPTYPKKFGLDLWARQNDLKTFADGVISTEILGDGSININGWHRELTTSTSVGLGAYWIQTTKNVFIVGHSNLIYHFNGSDWARININVMNHTVDPNADFWGVWADGKEVFISDTQNGIIYHGR